MTAALQYDLSMRKGSTYVLPVRWETEPWCYAAIASMDNTAPVRITTQDSIELPDGWNVAVVDAKGLTQLNAANNPPKPKDMHRATVVSATQVEFNPISAVAFGRHAARSGYLAWLTPHSLTNYTARLQIRDSIGGTVLLELTTENGGITLDDVSKVIEITVDATTTEALAGTNGVYDLELVSQGGVVTALLAGAANFPEEITTPIV